AEEVEEEMPARHGMVVEPQVDVRAPSNAQRSVLRQEEGLGSLPRDHEQSQPARGRAGPRLQAQRLRVGAHQDSPGAGRYPAVVAEGICWPPVVEQRQHLRVPFPEARIGMLLGAGCSPRKAISSGVVASRSPWARNQRSVSFTVTSSGRFEYPNSPPAFLESRK